MQGHVHGPNCNHGPHEHHGHSHGHGGHGHVHGPNCNHDHDHHHGHDHEEEEQRYRMEMERQRKQAIVRKQFTLLRLKGMHTVTEKHEFKAEAGKAAPPSVLIDYSLYKGEKEHMDTIMRMIQDELSEPYTVFTYRFFLNPDPDLCVLAYHDGKPIGVVVSRLDTHTSKMFGETCVRGYIGMLAVDKAFRGCKIGSQLVRYAMLLMADKGADEVILEAEVSNKGALGLYTSLGFIKQKRLHKYYLNGSDAFRLKRKLPLPPPPVMRPPPPPPHLMAAPQPPPGQPPLPATHTHTHAAPTDPSQAAASGAAPTHTHTHTHTQEEQFAEGGAVGGGGSVGGKGGKKKGKGKK